MIQRKGFLKDPEKRERKGKKNRTEQNRRRR